MTTTVLVSAAAAIVIGWAPSAGSISQAKPTMLSCTQTDYQNGMAPAVMTLRVAFSTRRLEQVAPSGKAYANRIAPNATITDNAIVWSARLMDTGLAKPVPMIWAGTIDRLSGASWDEFSREPDWRTYRVNYSCRVANQIIRNPN